MKEIRDKYLRIRVTSTEKKIFEEHCKKYKYNLSKRLRVIIEKELRNEI